MKTNTTYNFAIYILFTLFSYNIKAVSQDLFSTNNPRRINKKIISEKKTAIGKFLIEDAYASNNPSNFLCSSYFYIKFTGVSEITKSEMRLLKDRNPGVIGKIPGIKAGIYYDFNVINQIKMHGMVVREVTVDNKNMVLWNKCKYSSTEFSFPPIQNMCNGVGSLYTPKDFEYLKNYYTQCQLPIDYHPNEVIISNYLTRVGSWFLFGVGFP